jgi:hypothetical protein
MKQSKSRLLYGAIGLLGAAAAVLPLAIYHLVETAGTSGMHSMEMACEKACVAETFVGAAIAVIAIASLFIKNAKLSAASSAALLVGGVAAIAVPSLIGFCESKEMACRYITAPTLAILGSAIILLSAARFASGVIAARKTAEAV